MNATKRRIALEIVATDTHCGGIGPCPLILDNTDGCGAFGDAELECDEPAKAFKRLPECIAAEKAQKGGGGE